MASLYQIQMDFNHANSKANELDEIAGRLENVANKDMENMLNALGQDWKGDNATKYIKKGFANRDEMLKTVKSLRNTASTIRSIAKNIYEAEKRAYEIAEQRKREEAARAAEAARKLAEAAAGVLKK